MHIYGFHCPSCKVALNDDRVACTSCGKPYDTLIVALATEHYRTRKRLGGLVSSKTMDLSTASMLLDAASETLSVYIKMGVHVSSRTIIQIFELAVLTS